MSQEVKQPRIVLVGNPNVGKSVLFNVLTGSYATVSNYPGTSVEVSMGRSRIGSISYEVLDTPGMYSLMPITEEERVARKILLTERPDILLHVVDASDPCRREHVETTEELLVDLGLERVPRILVYNKCDKLETPQATLLDRGVPISALDPGSLGALKRAIEERIEVSHPMLQKTEPTSSQPA